MKFLNPVILNMLRVFLILILTCQALPGIAQSGSLTLNGRVTDKESGLPIQGISVYINNTTYSTQTAEDGTFRLTNIPLSNFELSFSAVNYETRTLIIDAGNIPALGIQMQKNTAILNEVVVTAAAEKAGWAEFGSTFTRDFLSYSLFSRSCEITNHQALRFRRNKKDNTLKALSREPLKIKNQALGYELTYWLEEYEHRFTTQTVFYKGAVHFTEMKGNKRKNNLWNRNRNIAYYGSLTHF